MRERRWYWGIQFSLLASSFLLLVTLWTIVYRQYTLMAAPISDCGCSIAPMQWPPSVIIGTSIAGAFAALLTIRLIYAVAVRGIRHERLARRARSQGRQIFHHRLGQSIWILDEPRQQAVTLGLFAPKIIVTSGLIRRLSGTELFTVLLHEAAHARSRDPLWSLLLESVGSTFGWIGGLRSIVNTAFSLREIIADSAATENYSHLGGLSGALYKLATASEPHVVPAFSPNTDRVSKVLDPAWRVPVQWWSWQRLVFVVAISAAVFLLGRLPTATAAARPTVPAEACWMRQVMCRGAGTDILLMSPDGSMSRYGW